MKFPFEITKLEDGSLQINFCLITPPTVNVATKKLIEMYKEGNIDSETYINLMSTVDDLHDKGWIK